MHRIMETRNCFATREGFTSIPVFKFTILMHGVSWLFHCYELQQSRVRDVCGFLIYAVISCPATCDMNMSAYPSVCRRYCSGFHSQNASYSGSRPWCGGAYLAGHLLFVWALAPFLFSCRPPYTEVLCPRGFGGPIRLPCNNAESFVFCGLSNNREWASLRCEAPSKWCLFSVSPAFENFSFPLGLGREHLWIGILKGRYINFEWLIDWTSITLRVFSTSAQRPFFLNPLY